MAKMIAAAILMAALSTSAMAQSQSPAMDEMMNGIPDAQLDELVRACSMSVATDEQIESAPNDLMLAVLRNCDGRKLNDQQVIKLLRGAEQWKLL